MVLAHRHPDILDTQADVKSLTTSQKTTDDPWVSSKHMHIAEKP